MLQVTGTGNVIIPPEHALRLHEEFMPWQLLKLPGFIEPAMLKRIMSHVERAEFFPSHYVDHKTERELGKEITTHVDNPAVHLLTMLLNNSRLFQIIGQITNSPTIRSFMGRIYRTLPNSDHHISWHNDNPASQRLIGISINLSPEPFSGGIFQLREKASQRILGEVANTGLGDAIIFRISRDLEHRATPLEGSAARTSGAGWFYAQPDFLTLLRECKT